MPIPRVMLRPYHPTWVVCYFADQHIASPDQNKKGFDYVHSLLKQNPDTEIELVQRYDDICLRCAKRVPNPKGSVWGKDSSCPSSDNPEVVANVHQSNRNTLDLIGLCYDSVVSWRELVQLLERKIPRLIDPMIGGMTNQEKYERGLSLLKSEIVSRRVA